MNGRRKEESFYISRKTISSSTLFIADGTVTEEVNTRATSCYLAESTEFNGLQLKSAGSFF